MGHEFESRRTHQNQQAATAIKVVAAFLFYSHRGNIHHPKELRFAIFERSYTRAVVAVFACSVDFHPEVTHWGCG